LTALYTRARACKGRPYEGLLERSRTISLDNVAYTPDRFYGLLRIFEGRYAYNARFFSQHLTYLTF